MQKKGGKTLQILKRLLPVSPEGVQLEYDALLLRRDLASLEVGPQVVHPPEPAALAASLQTCIKPGQCQTLGVRWELNHA